uniref:Uncharacterized protein n=1 Tax=Plectus sambesii TaxID=2011161 RepID=A0A914VFP3_9BILA
MRGTRKTLDTRSVASGRSKEVVECDRLARGAAEGADSLFGPRDDALALAADAPSAYTSAARAALISCMYLFVRVGRGVCRRAGAAAWGPLGGSAAVLRILQPGDSPLACNACGDAEQLSQSCDQDRSTNAIVLSFTALLTTDRRATTRKRGGDEAPLTAGRAERPFVSTINTQSKSEPERVQMARKMRTNRLAESDTRRTWPTCTVPLTHSQLRYIKRRAMPCMVDYDSVKKVETIDGNDEPEKRKKKYIRLFSQRNPFYWGRR